MSNDSDDGAGYRLTEAWRLYWTELFEGHSDWKSDLTSWAENNLIFYQEGPFRPEAISPEQSVPSWAVAMSIKATETGIHVSVDGLPEIEGRFFSAALRCFEPQWKSRNPLSNCSVGKSDSGLGKHQRKSLQSFVASIALGAGELIARALGNALARGALTVLALPPDDIFAERRPIPWDRVSGEFRVDMFRERLLLGSIGTPLDNVSISNASTTGGKTPRPGSFKADDERLVEKMKTLIDSGQTSSVVDAARQVEPNAPRRRQADAQSVVERLQSRFSRAYPGYTRRKEVR